MPSAKRCGWKPSRDFWRLAVGGSLGFVYRQINNWIINVTPGFIHNLLLDMGVLEPQKLALAMFVFGCDSGISLFLGVPLSREKRLNKQTDLGVVMVGLALEFVCGWLGSP